MYLFQENLLVKAIMDTCFSLNPVYVFKKRRFCAARKLNDTNREKLVLYWIQYKNALKCKVGCF